jgi:hypothetical protein
MRQAFHFQIHIFSNFQICIIQVNSYATRQLIDNYIVVVYGASTLYGIERALYENGQ